MEWNVNVKLSQKLKINFPLTTIWLSALFSVWNTGMSQEHAKLQPLKSYTLSWKNNSIEVP